MPQHTIEIENRNHNDGIEKGQVIDGISASLDKWIQMRDAIDQLMYICGEPCGMCAAQGGPTFCSTCAVQAPCNTIFDRVRDYLGSARKGAQQMVTDLYAIQNSQQQIEDWVRDGDDDQECECGGEMCSHCCRCPECRSIRQMEVDAGFEAIAEEDC